MDQRCSCETHPPPVPWPGFDFQRHSELCALCAGVVIRTGTRWAPLLCPACLELAQTANILAGFALVPRGRHSLANRLTDPAETTSNTTPASRLVNDLGGLAAGVEALAAWRQALVISRLPSEENDTSVDDYLTKIRLEAIDREDLLDQFIALRKSIPRPA